MEIFKGKGIVQKGGNTLCTCEYFIMDANQPGGTVPMTGSLEADGPMLSRVAKNYFPGDMAKGLFLIMEDGNKLEIGLILPKGENDQGKAHFSVIFGPGTADTLKKRDDSSLFPLN